MNFEEIVKQKEKELLLKNFIDLRKNINSPDYTYKIRNYCNKYNFDIKEVQQRILTDDIIASFFIKDPFKQNFIENLISNLLGIKRLPQMGKNCIRFDREGNICSEKSIAMTKSVDFIIKDAFITQKYTRNQGGAQDNQFQDVINFLNAGSIKNKVGALLDGEYWEEKRGILKAYYKTNENVIILCMDDLLGGIR